MRSGYGRVVPLEQYPPSFDVNGGPVVRRGALPTVRLAITTSSLPVGVRKAGHAILTII